MLLRLFERRQEDLPRHTADRFQQLETEPAPHDGTQREHTPALLTDPLQAATNDRPHPLWHIQLLDLEVGQPAGPDRLFPVNGNHSRETVLVPQEVVTAANPHDLKAESRERTE